MCPSQLRFLLNVAVTMGMCLGPYTARGDQNVQTVPDFETQVLPLLEAKCGTCHGAQKQEANVRFDQLSIDLLNDRAAAQVWHEARNAINLSEMPPEDEPQLSGAERDLVLSWMTASLKQAIEQQRSTNGRVVLRRLNNDEYQNTMFDLLGMEMDYTRDFPTDGLSPEGFRNNGRSLRMSAVQLEYYLATARRAVNRIIVSGPPPKVYRHDFEKSNVGVWRGPTELSNQLERAQKFLVKMVDDYPEKGEFRIRVKASAQLRHDKGYPLLEVSVGYRPDTQVHFRVVETREIVSESLQQYEFRGRLENFPLPVRGQGKYPGLVVRLRNAYTDGSPIPNKISKVKVGDKKVNRFAAEPHMPHLMIESLEFEAPFYTEWPPASHSRILFESDLRHTNESRYVQEVLRRFMRRAFRRPPADVEVTKLFAFFESVRQSYPSLEDAIRETMAMVLIQPEFLYLMEESGEEKRKVDDWELASRLSYFVWGTMPDKRLFELAEGRFLREPAILKAELQRMLANERSEYFASQFVKQWLKLESLQNVSVDTNYYTNFDDSLKPAMVDETVKFFAELLRHNESALNLLRSDFTVLNEPLARHYGVQGVFGQRFRPVELLDPDQRGGVLGHASVLLANSTGKDSHPIRRAVWIRDRLLDDPPAPPPPDVPELDEADPEFAKLTVREQLEIHREKETCANCHRNLDPWGIALENYDAIGLWRTSVRKKNGDRLETRPVKAADTLANGFTLDGVEGLREYLISNRQDAFARSLVKNLMSFALGRSLELSDELELDSITREFRNGGYRLRSLVEAVVASDSFHTK